MRKRQLNKDDCLEIALKYKTKTDFCENDGRVYRRAKSLSILDEVCSHMLKQAFSIPQLMLKFILTELLNISCLYNDRKAIKPYELDIYFPEYKLAFEYNGKGWHINDKINKEEICKNKGIKLFTLIENSRKYEVDIKNQLISVLEQINLITNKNIQISDINNLVISDSIYDSIIDVEGIKNICNKYSKFVDFVNDNYGLYQRLKSYNKLNEYTKHMVKNGGITEEEAILESKKYEYVNDFRNKSSKIYNWIKNKNKNYILNGLKHKNGHIIDQYL